MSDIIEKIEKSTMKKDLPEFRAGDSISVHFKVREGSKERIQVYTGVVIQRRGSGNRETCTVRKTSANIHVERIFPLHSPLVEKIKLNRRGKVHRARLFYLRNLEGKAARIKEKRIDKKT